VKETLRDLGINIGLLVAGFAGSLVMMKKEQRVKVKLKN